MLKQFLKEFKDFAQRGNAVDLAVGIIAGAAMNGVVNSLVKDIIMPPVGLLIGNIDMSGVAIRLSHNTTIGIGLFVNAVISFAITMFAIFLLVRLMNDIRGKHGPDTRDCPYCKMKIPAAATKCPNCCSNLPKVKK